MILDSLENKRNILSHFLQICSFDGWSEDTLNSAMKLADIDQKFKNLIFENGCLDLIEFYIDEKNHQLQLAIDANPDFSHFKIRQKIKFALYTTFNAEKSNQLALQRLRNFYFDYKNLTNVKYGLRPISLAFKHVMKISDFIWKAIDDKSTDFNFYTKRLTLAKIILQTFNIFLKDKSPDLQKTKSFIDLQIEKVMQFEKFKFKIKNISADLKNKSSEFFYDECGKIKHPRQLLKSLPFLRLFKK